MSLEQKNLPRKKRRKLEAAREMLEEENQSEKEVWILCTYFSLHSSVYGCVYCMHKYLCTRETGFFYEACCSSGGVLDLQSCDDLGVSLSS